MGSIRYIDRQPLSFVAANDPRFCQKEETNCRMIADSDNIHYQWRQVPCSDDALLCSAPVSFDLITDGDFTLDPSTNGWVLGSLWNWMTDKINISGSPGSTADQTVTQGGIPITNGHRYLLTFDILDYVDGSCLAELKGNSFFFSAEANGSYSFTIIAAGAGADELSFIGASLDGNDADFSLDNVALYDLGECWSATELTYADTVIFNIDGSICHTPDGDAIVTNASPLTDQTYYQVQFTITNRTAGYVQVFAGTAAGAQVSANGTFTQYLTDDGGTNFDIYFSADFDGCIDFVTAFPLRTDFIVLVLDMNGVVVADVSDRLFYHFDRVLLLLDLHQTTGSDGNPLPHGCYTLMILDPCTDIIQAIFDLITPATEVTDGIVLGVQICSGTPPGLGRIQLIFDAEVVNNGHLFNAYVNIGNNIVPLASGSHHYNIFVTVTSQETDLICFTYSQIITSIAGDSITVDNIEMNIIDPLNTAGQSECINFQEEFEGTILIQGIDWLTADGTPYRYSFGLLWHTNNFALSQRVFAGLKKATGVSKTDKDRYSTGVRYKSYVETSIKWDLVIADLDEVQHAAMDIALQCRYLSIGNNLYQSLTDEYQPKWDEKGFLKIVPVTVEVTKIDGILFAHND